MLIEDDLSFRGVIRDFLTESGYVVVTAQNGMEGVREVMRGDFAAILCDMVMPELAGEEFYRAVERKHPRLCERFVFMTGHLGTHQTIAFIRSVNREVLVKPFRLRVLLETLDVVMGVRRAESRVPFPPSVWGAETPPVERSDSGAEAPSSPSPAPPARVVVPVHRYRIPPWRQAGWNARGGSPSETRLPVFLAAVFMIWLAAMAGLWLRATILRERLSAADTDLQTAKEEWAAISPHLEKAEEARARIEALIDLPKRVAAARDVPGWTTALRSFATRPGSEITVDDIRADGRAAQPGACAVRVRVASGRSRGWR